MPKKLKNHFFIDLTPEQIATANRWLEQLDTDGGMLIGSVQSYFGETRNVRRVGFRLVNIETAEKLVEIANAQGENEDA